MKTSSTLAFAFLFAGCHISPQPGATLTVEQAQAAAVQLANDKASAQFHCRPFRNGQPAEFAEGRWIWVGRQGYGQLDFVATVELAADGSTNSVNLNLLDSRVRPIR